MASPDYQIVSYNPAYKNAFKALNIRWLEEFFLVEPYDRKVLSDPETYIIGKNGAIYFAVRDGEVLGTVALMETFKGRFELTKLAVDPVAQGLGVGEALCNKVIDTFLKSGGDCLFLETNTKLVPAIKLYEKLNFVEKELGQDSPYERADYYMEWAGNAA